MPSVKQEPVTEEQEEEHVEEAGQEEELLVRGSTLGLLRQGAVGVPEFSVWMESVWFRHVGKPNFLLADSYPVHTAAPTQAALLKVHRRCSQLIGPSSQLNHSVNSSLPTQYSTRVLW